jgi:hypothetical protein
VEVVERQRARRLHLARPWCAELWRLVGAIQLQDLSRCAAMCDLVHSAIGGIDAISIPFDPQLEPASRT